MKKIVLLIISIALCQNIYSQKDYFDQFKKPIKKITCKAYEVTSKFGDIIKGDEVSYDYKVTRNLDAYTDINLNRAGKVIEAKGVVLSYRRFYLNNKLVKELSYYRSSIFSKNLFKYKNNKKIEKTHYDKDNKITEKSKYKYDARGNMVQEIIYKTNGDLQGFISYKYSNSKKLIELNSLKSNLDTKFLCVEKLKYNNRGNCIEVLRYNDEGDLTSRVEYKYNNNKRVKETLFSENSYKREYKKFDKYGNWTEMLLYKTAESLEPQNMVIREFEYYY